MNLLHSNDTRGHYPASWYAATATPPAPRAPLKGELRADVCIVGAGYTGLSAALHLAQAGRRVVVLEAHRAGFGASGRNGGQLLMGQRKDQQALERLTGREDAARLWDLAEEALDLVDGLIQAHGIDCALKWGAAFTAFNAREMDEMHGQADHLARHYGCDRIETLDRDAMAAICPSEAYHGGLFDPRSGHLHPLNYALGLARAAEAAGAVIHEGAEVHHLEDGAPCVVQTGQGRVLADHVILACNGYMGGLNRKVAAHVMPINNFIIATEPLGDEAARVLTRDICVSDTKFVVNYFRLSPDRRVLWGGGESYGYRFPDDIAAVVRKPMLEIFPHLRDVRIDYAWGGTLAITMKRMPYLARVGRHVLSASGYSGHGVGTATHAGMLMARAIEGETDGFDVLSRVPATPFPGGPAFRSPLLALAMTWYAMRDRLGV
ncbi:MAG: FAD-binding oxidoreductase [Rhodobacteraceae bacterium]|nr:MAG: FAD-binding oxidoreductase [Paracoccaceae bacterium]